MHLPYMKNQIIYLISCTIKKYIRSLIDFKKNIIIFFLVLIGSTIVNSWVNGGALGFIGFLTNEFFTKSNRIIYGHRVYRFDRQSRSDIKIIIIS